MGISLNKGGRVDLNKEAPNLTKVIVGLGWDTNRTNTGNDFDLDASVFLLAANGKVANEKDFIFYNNLKSTDGSIEHTGDNLTGEGEGDDESVIVDLTRVNPNISEIVFVVTIHDATTRGQNFGQVQNSFIRLVNASNNNEIAKYELDEDYSTETAIEFGRVYKKNDTWRFKAVGSGFNNGLKGFCDMFGVATN